MCRIANYELPSRLIKGKFDEYPAHNLPRNSAAFSAVPIPKKKKKKCNLGLLIHIMFLTADVKGSVGKYGIASFVIEIKPGMYPRAD